MSIIRRAAPLEGNFYILDKRISEDKDLSWAARGLLVFLLGKPANWQVSVHNLINQTEKARTKSGRDAVRALLKELSDSGYIRKYAIKGDDGKFLGFGYEVTEEKSKEDSPSPDNPSPVEPLPVNPPLISIDVLTRNELKQTSVNKLTGEVWGELFKDFWKAYPKKVGKDSALKAFAKRKPDAALLQLMLDALKKHKQSDQWLKDGGQFIPHPATWLNAGRWQDEEENGEMAEDDYRNVGRFV